VSQEPPPPPPGPVDPRVLGLLDPVAEVLQGALPYADRSAAVPDGQPVPTTRVRRVLTISGLRLSVDSHLDDRPIASTRLEVDRLPLDREIAGMRARTHPAPTSFLVLEDAFSPRTVPLADGAPIETALVEPPGPGRRDILTLLDQARTHRLVVLDLPADRDAVLMGSLVLQLAAAGIPCWCRDELVRSLTLLAPDLRAALSFDLETAVTDDLELAAVTARQRRAAWAGHDLRLAWGEDGVGTGWAAGLRPVPLGSVTVVLVSRRPHVVPSSLAMIAAQQGVDLEVVVALHGGGDPSAVQAELRALQLEGSVLAVPSEVPFGSVINAAAARGHGRFVLKWDDDDLYGPTHVLDLLVAQRQTGAGLVGKSPEFIYFEDEGETIWRSPHRAESYYRWLAGGTFLTRRDVLDEVGGYPDITRAVDHHLKLRIHERGLGVFRTHGFGFALRRHGGGHTWEVTSEHLRQKAERTFTGLPDIIGLGDTGRLLTLPDA
jgi:hypothetical protein